MGIASVITLDTHSWLWWVTEPAYLSDAAMNAIADADVLCIPAIVCWEMARLVDRGRIQLALEITEWLHRALSDPRARLIALSPEIAVQANAFGDTLHRDPADRLIVATAMELSAPLITKDAHIQAFGGVETVW